MSISNKKTKKNTSVKEISSIHPVQPITKEKYPSNVFLDELSNTNATNATNATKLDKDGKVFCMEFQIVFITSVIVKKTF